MERHNDMYFTMWYGVYDKPKRRLAYANGGHPAPILIAGSTPDTAEPVQLSQPGIVIGAFPGIPYKAEVRDLPEFSRLYLFSDGIYEVSRPDGTMLTYEEFMAVLAESERTAGSALEKTISAIRAVRGGDQFEDDVSIVEITF